MNTADKVRHVLRAGQTRDHTCHWPGCDRQVPPAMWGCRPHWYSLPKDLRDAIWRTYRPGQEISRTPSESYLQAARNAQRWIAEHGKVAGAGCMKALSILQPWAWLIVRPDITDQAQRAEARRYQRIKDVENRNWPTSFRGRFLIHAGKTYARRTHDEHALKLGDDWCGIALPQYEQMQLGGIIGSVELVDCVTHHESPWADDGAFKFVLKDARPEPFRPYRGQLGFFDVPNEETAPAAPQGSLL